MKNRRTLYPSLVIALLLSTVAGHSEQNPKAREGLQSANLDLRNPKKEGSVRFAVIGDSGTGGKAQRELAEVMTRYHDSYPFEFVLMLGDNLYGGESPSDYRKKFEEPYRELLARNVKFYASLGNHDNSAQRNYPLFNMSGRRYYNFNKGNVAFFALDTDNLTQDELSWVDGALGASRSLWKICFFHHPLYSSGARHGSSKKKRKSLEPIFLQHGVNVVFSGHDHVYERILPQKGIQYFVSGAAAKLRKGNLRKSALTAKGFDQDNSFMLIEIDDEAFHFQTISRSGETVDSGSIPAPRAGLDDSAPSSEPAGQN